MYKVNEAIKKMWSIALMAQKKSKELSSEILVQKVANLTRHVRQRNDVVHLLSHLVLIDEEKREVRSKARRGEGEDSLVRLCLHRPLIPQVPRARKRTKKSRGSILYRMKIILNGTFRLSLHLTLTCRIVGGSHFQFFGKLYHLFNFIKTHPQ